jgi:NAD(P)-dependent dehydrogenase (short-subunit alcohol dehydrogenase family)
VRALAAAGHDVAILDREGAFAVRRGGAVAVPGTRAGHVRPRLWPDHLHRLHTVWRPPAADFLPYVVGKAAPIGLARSLAKPLGAHGITVNCVAPGLTRTPFTEADLPAPAFEDVRARQALPRSLVPEDTAGLVAFLASDAAAAITGQTLVTDGGSILR